MAAIGIMGIMGRMGREIAIAIRAHDGLIAGGAHSSFVASELDGFQLYPGAQSLAQASDVMIDFTRSTALPDTLRACVALHRPLLIGTTGLSREHHALIDAAAARIPVLQTGNTAVGVHMLAALARRAAAQLGDGWDVEIVEMHHRHKLDAPSGTALLLGNAVAEGRGQKLPSVRTDCRAGSAEPRRHGEIGFASLRGGSVVGDHKVILAGNGERIELVHRAESRAIFAEGALRAALWLIGKASGRYEMQDVLRA